MTEALTFIGNILLFIIILSVVITLHEIGHFFFARKAGILCYEFSLGMGPRLFSKKIGETTYSIRAIPFGGFVSMAGEEVEAAIVRVGDEVRLKLDSSGFVEEIIVDTSHPLYQDNPLVKIEIIDLLGKDNEPLYINEFPVRRNATYVFMKRTMQIAPYDRVFSSKTKMQRFLTTVAGPVMNIVLAFVILLGLSFLYGVPNYDSTRIGVISENLPAYGELQEGDIIVAVNGVLIFAWSDSSNTYTLQSELAKPSDTGYVFRVFRNGELIDVGPIYKMYTFYGLGFTSKAGTSELIISGPVYQTQVGQFKDGDKIISINGRTFEHWSEVIQYANTEYAGGSTKENPAQIVLERDGVILEPISYTAYGEDVLPAIGVPALVMQTIGIGPSNHFSFFGSIRDSATQLGNYSTMIFTTLKQLFAGGQIGVDDLGSFPSIYQATARAAEGGFRVLLSWVALLSVNLGILNLLPIPALDGGRLVFIGYEAVTGRKPNQKVENLLHMVAFFLLMGLMVFALFNDILRIIGLK